MRGHYGALRQRPAWRESPYALYAHRGRRGHGPQRLSRLAAAAGPPLHRLTLNSTHRTQSQNTAPDATHGHGPLRLGHVPMSAPAPGQGGAAVPSSRDSTGFEVPYELCTSAIAGIGVFATTPLARGTLLWRADSRSQVVHTEATLRERLASLSSTEAIELLEHVYCWEGEARGAHMPSLVLCSPLRTVIWLGSRRQELE